MGRQSPKSVVLQKPEDFAQLEKMNARIMGKPDAHPFYGAPTVVAVLADKNVMTYVEDGSLVMGNLMNAAFSVGVDSCWIHRARQVFDTEYGRQLLRRHGISDDYVGIGNCILGYRDCKLPDASERRDNRIYNI